MSQGFGEQYDKTEEEEEEEEQQQQQQQQQQKFAVSSVFSATKQRPSNDEKWHVNTKIKH